MNVEVTRYTKDVNFSFVIDQDVLKRAGLKSGDNIFVCAFAAPYSGYYYTNFYYDVKLKKNVWTALNPTPSQIISFTLK